MEKYFESRIIRIKQELEFKNIPGFVILKDANIYYLTGFYSKDSGSILAFVNDEIYLLVHFIYFEAAKKSVLPKNVKIIKYFTEKYKKLLEIISSYKIKNIAVEGDNISFIDFSTFKVMLAKAGKKLTSESGIVENLRIIKDEIELANIQKACSISDKVFTQIAGTNSLKIKSFSEIGLAFEMERKSMKHGSSGKSFNYVIANKSMSSLPHYEAENKNIKNGILLMDFGCIYNHYCSDITRTVFIGNFKNSNKIRQIYDIVLQAQSKSLQSCKAGVSTIEIDGIARKYIEGKGYGDNFGHGLGHGVGLEVHESPRISYINETILQENMVITIEPGIYIENFGGVRIEDMVIIKENRCQNLYKSSKLYTVIK
ncbi:MAG: Xaa-Pro peptidase family protein [Actinobacteria bacterium]|nr:Xaa-Pro peptidase family protein [Actinomycetota bacterium]